MASWSAGARPAPARQALPPTRGSSSPTGRTAQTISTDDPNWILDWYVNFIALKGVAFHQYDLPGLPASHGCVRLLEEDARWMFDWTQAWVPGRGSAVTRYGTPVLVFGDWDAGAPAPWLTVTEDGARAEVSSWELGAALAPHLELALERSALPVEVLASR